MLDELTEIAKHRYMPPAYRARVYAGLGEKDEAFVWLGKAYKERSDWLVYLRSDSRLDPLRSDPRFTDLLRRMNLLP